MIRRKFFFPLAIVQAFFFTLISGLHCFAQEKHPDYILVGTEFSQGKLTFSNDTVTFLKRKYTAANLDEFRTGRHVYISLSHEGIPKFYEKIIEGKVSLYGRERQFSLKKGDTTNLLTKENFRIDLINMLHCERSSNFIPYVKYNRSSLTNAIKRYNTQGCGGGYFPYNKFGVTAGFSRLSLKGYFHDKQNDFKAQSNGVFIGAFGDFPLFVKEKLSIRVEAHYLFSEFSIYSENFYALNFTEGKVNAITIPFGIKWLNVEKKVKTYFKVGGLLSVVNLKTDGVYTASISNHAMETSFEEMNKPTSLGVGVDSAIGLEIPWKELKNINLELQYFKSFGLSQSPLKQVSSFSLAVGVNL